MGQYEKIKATRIPKRLLILQRERGRERERDREKERGLNETYFPAYPRP